MRQANEGEALPAEGTGTRTRAVGLPEVPASVASRRAAGSCGPSDEDVGQAREAARQARQRRLGFILGVPGAYLWCRIMSGRPLNFFSLPSLPNNPYLYPLPSLLIVVLSPPHPWRPAHGYVGLPPRVGRPPRNREPQRATAPRERGEPSRGKRARPPRDYSMSSKIMNIGMYSEITIAPTMPPRKAIITGSSSAVSDSVVAATSWS